MSGPTLQSAPVRDLYWACASPGLMRHPLGDAGLLVPDPDWIVALDRNPGPLIDYLGRAPQGKLGLYFETLWAYFLENNPATELISRNLPVRASEGGRTLGEFDFIYYCHRRESFVHLEVAVKFYLGLGVLYPAAADSPTAMSRWWGPGCRDRLNLKYRRMLAHQARLSETPEGRTTLQALGVDHAAPEICLRGRLFYPLAEVLPAPENADPFHLRGSWLALSDFQHADLPNTGWRVLRKPGWLSGSWVDAMPVHSLEQCRDRLANLLTSGSGPVMVSCAEANANANIGLASCWSGQRYYFVTPGEWPALGDNSLTS